MRTAHVEMTDANIIDALLPYGVHADSELCQRVRIYTSTLLQWNSKIALTAITDPEEILRVHFGESFYTALVAKIAGGRVADIGTGAGFPGIPVRMVRPSVQLTLVEPIGKKTAFLAETLRRINLTGVDIIRYRMEDISHEITGFDFVTARALGKYKALLRWSRTRLSQTGQIVLLVGRAEAENLSQNAEWEWSSMTNVPMTTSRVVLVGRRRRQISQA